MALEIFDIVKTVLPSLLVEQLQGDEVKKLKDLLAEADVSDISVALSSQFKLTVQLDLLNLYVAKCHNLPVYILPQSFDLLIIGSHLINYCLVVYTAIRKEFMPRSRRVPT